jgi:D-glycero-alpha-D-manno-heptose-7-phosphate kinase
MIITKTPYRISLFGGGSDFPQWYRDNTGKVISFSIDKYCYIAFRPLPAFIDYNFRIVYSKTEIKNNVHEIEHPAVREAIKEYLNDKKIPKLEIQHFGDLPARSGVGSSSAFAVGLVSGLTRLNNQSISKSDIALQAIRLEQQILKQNVGSQDQIACSIGGINEIHFGLGDSISHSKIEISKERIFEIENRMVVVYSGIQRDSSEINIKLLQNLKTSRDIIKKNSEFVSECVKILRSESNLDSIGLMLDESWGLKKLLNPNSTSEQIDALYKKAKQNGAIGGKVLGAGGGGFMMFWLPFGYKETFLRSIGATFIPFKIEFEGTTVIFNSDSKRRI